jgi:hypothetical protein
VTTKDSTSVNQIFKLGQVSFTVFGTEESIQVELPRLFPPGSTKAARIHEASVSGGNIRTIISNLLAEHSHCLWFDAACLLSPEAKKLLIVGGSGSGKSTSAMALVFGHGWKVFCEDIALIDPNTDELLSFPSPFSLKEGTLDHLRTASKIEPESVILNEWIPMPSSLVAETCAATFDVVIRLDAARNDIPLECKELSAGDFMRVILPNSNLIHHDEGFEKTMQYIKNARCYRLTGGTLLERIEKIFELTRT